MYEPVSIELTFEEQAVVMAALGMLQEAVRAGTVANGFFVGQTLLDLAQSVKGKIMPTYRALGLI